MARNKELTIDQATALADGWHDMGDVYKEAQRLTARFADASPQRVIEMWESGRNEKGRPLSKFEVQALGERWCELFGCLPPTLGTNSFPPTPAEPESQDDTILGMREVRRMTGLSTSTIKRQMARRSQRPRRSASGGSVGRRIRSRRGKPSGRLGWSADAQQTSNRPEPFSNRPAPIRWRKKHCCQGRRAGVGTPDAARRKSYEREFTPGSLPRFSGPTLLGDLSVCALSRAPHQRPANRDPAQSMVWNFSQHQPHGFKAPVHATKQRPEVRPVTLSGGHPRAPLRP